MLKPKPVVASTAFKFKSLTVPFPSLSRPSYFSIFQHLLTLLSLSDLLDCYHYDIQQWEYLGKLFHVFYLVLKEYANPSKYYCLQKCKYSEKRNSQIHFSRF